MKLKQLFTHFIFILVNKHLCLVSVSVINVFFIKNAGEVYGIGLNRYKELGPGSSLNCFQKLSVFADHIFTANNLYIGKNRFNIKTIDNRIYSIGHNNDGVCGCGMDRVKHQSIDTFTEIDMKNIKLNPSTNEIISCILGRNSNAMIFSINGIIYAVGRNYEFSRCCSYSNSTIPNNLFGQSQNSSRFYESPIKMNHKLPTDFSNIVQIECTDSIVICLNDKGKMIRWGTRHEQIKMVACDALIQTIKCGNEHCLCLSTKNKLFVFGDNRQNQCGIYDQSRTRYIYNPTLCPSLKNKNIVYVNTLRNHSLVIDNEYRAYLFGDNSSYQVSKMQRNQKIAVFQRLNRDEFYETEIVSGSCGDGHTVLLTKESRVITFGNNESKQCCPSKELKLMKYPYMLKPKEIGIKDYYQIIRVIAADSTTLIIVA